MKYIATTIAASIFSFNVMAADSSHCNSLDKGPQFNKTVLSEFDKCWLNTHRSDKKSGVDGNVFWMKIDGKFISMPTKDLFANGKNGAKEIIKDKIIDSVSKDLADKLSQQVSDLQAQINILTPLAESVEGLKAKISQLETARDNALAQIPHEATFTLPNGREVGLGYHVDGNGNRYVTYTQNGINIADASERGAQGAERAFNDALRFMPLSDFRDMVGNIAYNAFRNRIITAAKSHIPTVTPDDVTESRRGTNYTPVGNTEVWGVNDEDGNATNRYIPTAGNSFTISQVIIDAANLDSLTLANLDVAIEEAYNAGYDDGYDAGYADGYRDGFRDGVEDAMGN